ncbi:hypothetical protein MiSe_55520 [Microseira wollei NIES-4236]|uniref:DUF1822 family protein n=2 Tax=Microseira wollei TaxID=467598 RepID=A0AAV3XH25_9CYAN|nr:hypothetical protein MiSe_55520 [Microseira wollei NIES-4236]
MTPTINHILEKSIPLPITTAAVRIARQFADQQPTPEKQQQVYFNTLAVCAVHDYMQMMDIPTDLKGSDSWNPAIGIYHDAADLKLTGLGKLECRPIQAACWQKSGQPICYIPPEMPDDRIGIVVVAIDDLRQEATLLGFVEKTATSELSINQLQTIDDLLEYLERLELPIVAPVPAVNLSQWFQHIFAAGWQSLEALLSSNAANLAPMLRKSATVRLTTNNKTFSASNLKCFEQRDATKSSIKAAKLIDLGIQLGNQSVVLLMALTSEENEKVGISVQVHPTQEKYLPPNLKLVMLSQTGETVQEVASRSQDNFIQLRRFKTQPGTCFSIQVHLDDLNITEDFMV